MGTRQRIYDGFSTKTTISLPFVSGSRYKPNNIATDGSGTWLAWKFQPSGRILKSSDNLTINLSQLNTDLGIEQFVMKEQSRAPIFDFRDLDEQQITGTIEISREADFNTTLGFYKILDTEGTVLDPLTNELITTSHAEYDSYALSDDNKVSFGSNHLESTFYVEDDSTTLFDITIEDFELIAPYATVIGEGGKERTYFAFDGVNSARHGSNMSHFKVFGDNTLGIEDTIGGGDNDLSLIHI